MEEDRAQVDLGKAFDAELGAEKQEKQKQPRKRFIGRKEAAERAEKGDTSEIIEDSGAIQGVRRALKVCAQGTDILKLHNQERRPERSTKFLRKSLTIPISRMPYLFYLRTTPSKYTRQSIEYAHLVPRR